MEWTGELYQKAEMTIDWQMVEQDAEMTGQQVEAEMTRTEKQKCLAS